MHDLLRATPSETRAILANARIAPAADDQLAIERVFHARLSYRAPTPEELRLHLLRFGSTSGGTAAERVKRSSENRQAVDLVARVYAVNMEAESKSVVWTTDESGRQIRDRETEAKIARAKATGKLKKGRRLTDDLCAEIRELSDQGLTPLAISKRLNYGERSVLRILKEPRLLAVSA